MPSSHVYADLSAGFFRYRASDGTRSHIHVVHTSLATIDNTVDPGSPAGADTLIHPEVDVNCTARNFLTMLAPLVASSIQLTLLDYVDVLSGLPQHPPFALQPYTLAGGTTGNTVPEAEVSFTFRDLEGAPMRFVIFGDTPLWRPAFLIGQVPSWAGVAAQQFSAYIIGEARTGGVTYAANLTNVCSHNGKRAITALNIVSGLNNRLRREYRVK
jgi:hypothetical protein